MTDRERAAETKMSDPQALTPSALEIRRLSDRLGAEVRNLDLAQPLESITTEALRDAFLVHRALLFRDQALTTERQVEIAEIFGPVETTRSPEEGPAGAPRVVHVANREVDGRPGILPEGAMQPHIDYCFREKPYKAVMLYALEAPDQGGATLLIDAQAAYDALPAETRARLISLTALNAYRYGSLDREPVSPEMPQHSHPVAIRHPETGQPSLFVNRLMTDHVVELSREQSDALLTSLFDHLEQPCFTLMHHWRRGDLLIWDNRCTLHGRSDFDPSETRVLRRLTLSGGPLETVA